jgi:hypothetical protein
LISAKPSGGDTDILLSAWIATPPVLYLLSQAADHPVEKPDLDIMAIDKLSGGLQRFFVAVGFDRFEGLHPVVFINEIGPIRRHDSLRRG